MDYYSSLNSASQQSSSLDYASSQLLGAGTQNYTEQMDGFNNELSQQIADINAEYTGTIAQITGAFARKDTAKEQLTGALEGAGAGLEFAKGAKAGIEKYSAKAKELRTKAGELSDKVQQKAGELSDTAQEKVGELKGQAEGKISEARGRVSNARFSDTIDDMADATDGVELAPIDPAVPDLYNLTETPSVAPSYEAPTTETSARVEVPDELTTMPTDATGDAKPSMFSQDIVGEDAVKELPREMKDPTAEERTTFDFENPPPTNEGEVRTALDAGRDTYETPFSELKKPDLPEAPAIENPALATEGATEGAEGAIAGVSEAIEGGTAIGLEETAGEVAVAGAFDPVVDVVAGGLMVAGAVVGIVDLFSKKESEKKIKKKEEKADTLAQNEQDDAQAQYDAQVSASSTQYDTIRNNITANTHAGITIGVQNMRNTYKSGGTF